MYPCLPTKCGLVFCPHLRYLTISSFSQREALTCANQPFCSLGRVWSLITPDCSWSHGYLKSPASLFLREPHGMFLASIDLLDHNQVILDWSLLSLSPWLVWVHRSILRLLGFSPFLSLWIPASQVDAVLRDSGLLSTVKRGLVLHPPCLTEILMKWNSYLFAL